MSEKPKSPVRKSSRVNKGVPPARHDEYLESQRVKHKQPEAVKEVKKKPKSVSRLSSSCTWKSVVVASAHISLETEKKIAEIEKGLTGKEKDLEILRNDSGRMQKELDELQKAIENTTENSEQNQVLIERLEEKKSSWEALKNDIYNAETALKYDRKLGQKDIELLRMEEDLKKQELEQANSSDDSDNESERKRRVDEWAKSTVHHKIKNNASNVVNDDMLNTFRAMFQGQTGSDNSHPFQSSATPSNDLAMLVVENLFKMVNGPHKQNTEKLLARQIHGRDLPVFTGKPEEWMPFILAYESTKRECQFTDEEDLARLRKCVRGDALRCIQGLLTTAKNVPEIMNVLRIRYGRPDQIIKELAAKVRSYPVLKAERLESLVDYGCEVQNLVSTIKSLGANNYLTNPLLVEEAVNKLPAVWKCEWAEHKLKNCSEEPELGAFSTWLKTKSDAAASICDFSGGTIERSRGKRNLSERERVYSTAAMKRSKKSHELRCSVCKMGHKVVDCPKFKDLGVDERWKLARENKLCFGCLNVNHNFRDCRSKRACNLEGCQKEHHRLLHNKPAESRSEVVQFMREVAPVNLMVLPVTVRGPRRSVETFAMFDNGSTITMIDEDLAFRVGADGPITKTTIAGFQSEPNEYTSKTVGFNLASKNGRFTCIMQNVKTVTNLNLRKQSVRRSVVSKWTHLRGVPLEFYDDAKPLLLIGSDNPCLMRQLDFRYGKPNSPVAVKTPLGWVLQGRSVMDPQATSFHVFSADDKLHEMVKESFAIESIGVKTPVLQACREDQKAQEILDKTIKLIDNQYECGLLWRNENPRFPDNYDQALKRLKSMERKMDRDPEFAKQYEQKIQDYLEKGFARVLSAKELKVKSDKSNYIPHFMHYNPKKPGKLRFVFDAAAKFMGKSLNDYLLQGPDKLISLPSVLLKFRRKPIGMTADIKDMFHMIKVREDDRPAQRFLWRGMERDRAPDVYQMDVLIFGATCSPTCAQEVKNTNAKRFEVEYPLAVDAIMNKHYMDDYLDSVDTLDEAFRMFTDIRHIHGSGGFHLCNWTSNSKSLMQKIPQNLRAATRKCLESSDNAVERVLGLFWDTTLDSFTFSLNYVKVNQSVMDGERAPTKREMLSTVMSIFDPLGFIGILTIKARILMQELWTAKLSWDEQISGIKFCRWKTWLELLKEIPSFKLPRCYNSQFMKSQNIQLHIFCDASEAAYGCVGYFRFKCGETFNVKLIMSKSRVSPLKKVSIQWLELQAAVLGTRMASFIRLNHGVDVDKVVYWTDSMTVLYWIRSETKRYKDFVAHRIGEIQEYSNPEQWKWVSTHNNVADELTRFDGKCDWSEKSRWLNGPAFLKSAEELWPLEKISRSLEDLEVKREYVNIIKSIDKFCPIDVLKFSSYQKLIRVTAYVLRMSSQQKTYRKRGNSILPDEFGNAEACWWKLVQGEAFGQNPSAHMGKDRFLRNQQYKDVNGVVRVSGRLENSDVDYATKYPVVLPSNHPFTLLVVQYYHQICGHHGYEKICNEIRQKYYIPRLRTAVKAAKMACLRCKIEGARPHPPLMGSLPKYRLLRDVRPFQNCGMDYFGPIEVIVKRSREKRYGVLFTCLSTRAVHLEIAHSLSTDSCIQAIRRFASRRGCPDNIFSDNGKNLVGANSELKESVTSLGRDELEKFCSTNAITWHFIPPAAPHMGGSWERMVGSVKKALGKTLLSHNLKDEALLTFIAEAEHTVNCHPLTHVSDDPDDSEAITPNHFLLGKSSNLQRWGDFTDAELLGRKEWRCVQHMNDQFWRRWVREYLPTLLRRDKWNKITRPIRVGDVVIEVNPNLSRNEWPKGIVCNLYPGKDGIVRVVDLRRSSGKIYRRPVSRLCILDVQWNSGTGTGSQK